jgi:hypothetical protein
MRKIAYSLLCGAETLVDTLFKAILISFGIVGSATVLLLIYSFIKHLFTGCC